jgi:signal peptidase I
VAGPAEADQGERPGGAEAGGCSAFETFYIPSASMVPTLGVYDRILVQRLFFNWHDVREDEIVVFSEPPADHCGGPSQARAASTLTVFPPR